MSTLSSATATQELEPDALKSALLAAGNAPRGVAKYEYLRSCMASAIEEGRWPVGMRLPPELEIAAATRLSLGTVQRALRELVSQGYLIRRQGRGTFVANRRKRMEEPLHCQFVDAGGSTVLPVYTRLVRRRRESQEGPWSAVLGFDNSGYVMLDRTIDVDGRFLIASRMYVGASRFGRLMSVPRKQFDGVNLKKLLAKEFSVSVGRVEQRLRMEQPDPEIISWLERDELPYVLSVRAIGFERNGTTVYFQKLWMPPVDEELLIESLVE